MLNLVGGTSGYVRLIASDPVGSDPGVASPSAPPAPRPSLAAALSSLALELPVDIDVLRGLGRGRAASWSRALAAYVLVRRLGYRVTDVAAALGRTVATTSIAVREISERLPGDEAAARQVDRVVESLNVKVRA